MRWLGSSDTFLLTEFAITLKFILSTPLEIHHYLEKRRSSDSGH